MEGQTLFIVVCVALVGHYQASGTVCQNSYDCVGSSQCCRDSAGSIISDQQIGGFGPLQPIGGAAQQGTCSTRLAQKGELCDSSCDCDTGLLCYRPMSGVCCPPRTCYDAAYVKQQQAYWSNCLSNPSCAIPP